MRIMNICQEMALYLIKKVAYDNIHTHVPLYLHGPGQVTRLGQKKNVIIDTRVSREYEKVFAKVN